MLNATTPNLLTIPQDRYYGIISLYLQYNYKFLRPHNFTIKIYIMHFTIKCTMNIWNDERMYK